MKKKFKWILFFLLLISGTAAAWYFLWYQPKPQVVEEIGDGKSYTEQSEGDGEKEDAVVLNQNVHVYMGEEAAEVNEAIVSLDYSDSDLVIKFNKETEIDFTELESGELFWLEGDKNTPLQDTYIGKVTFNDTNGDEILLGVEPPMIDEVFDEFYLDEEMQIDASNINSISTVEGVKITPVETVPADFMETAANEDSQETMNLVYDKSEEVGITKTASSALGSFVVELDVDMSEIFEMNESTKETLDALGAERKCKLTGKMGIEDLSINYKADWDKDSYGMKELSIGVSGKQVVKTGFEFAYEGEVSGEKTEKEITSFIKLQGLEEKLFPIAYFDCTPGKTVALKPNTVGKIGNKVNTEIENNYKLVPLSCGFMVYVDLNGNVSLKAVMNYNYSDEFENKLVLVKDNELVNEFEGKSDPKSGYTATLEAKADVDTHIGASVMAYFFNINMADVAIVKLGFEAEGKGTFQATSESEADSGIDVDLYARLYAKIIDAKANMKVQVNLWKILNASGEIEFEKTLLNLTLAETGQKKDTHFDENTMLWRKMTAEDEDASYYKALNGKLIRESKKNLSRETIYDKEFFSICGVDQSYIYVLQATEDEKYDVRRINKDGTTSKIILKDVKYVLLMEDTYMYYVPDFSPQEIYSLDRATLKKTKFADFDYNVEYLGREEEGYFVVTQEENAFSWLFGPECTYYRISGEGAILQTYDENITPEETLREEFENYNVSYKLLSNGYLRETAQSVYWLSQDAASYIETEGCSGWKPTEAGILTEQENDDGTYSVILYRAQDGSPQEIVKVSGREAFFTFVQDTKGNWYYMDQTETDWELYKMDASFKNLKQIAKISREEIISNEEECSMEIVDNRIFYYTMPEWSESKVLYRYNLF